MKTFRGQIRLEREDMHFYAECAVCKKRERDGKLPFRCEDESCLEDARRQTYDKCRAAAADHLTRLFNRCPVCGRWVCDGCFDLADGYGACTECAKK